MLFVACGAEMISVNVVQVEDDTTGAASVERSPFHVFRKCYELKGHRVSTKHGPETDAAPPILPASAVQDEHIAALLRRMVAKIRGQ